MYLRGLRLHNIGRYAGEHTLELEDKVYAIVAHHKAHQGRSNWLGKSTIPYAIRWCLTGIKPKFARLEDDIITRGKDSGGVEIEWSDGTLISRMRESTTELWVSLPDGRELKKGEAQAHIDAILGVGAGVGSSNVWFIEQKNLDRFVSMDPSERARTATQWFDLSGLEKAEEALGEQLKKSIETRDKLVRREAEIRAGITTRSILELESEVLALEDELTVRKRAWEQQNGALLKREHRQAREAERALTQAKLDALRATARAHLIAKPLADSDPKAHAAASKEHETQVAAYAISSSRLIATQKLERGEFDGICPVSNRDCPVKLEINGDRKTNKRLRDEALAEHTRVTENRARALSTLQGFADSAARLMNWQTKQQAIETEIEFYETKLSELLPAEVEEATPPDQSYVNDFDEFRLKVAEAKREIVRQRELRHKCSELSLEIEQAELAMRVDARARACVGKNGAQKRIVMGEFAQIEHATNMILERAKIDLSARIQWGRETNAPASVCDGCGWQYGKSANPKVCPVCKSLRGKKIDDRLFIEPSAVSGGADDLVGCVVQLAVSSYLRHRGTCEFASMTIDEPFGSLDEHNRTELSGTLVSLLEQFGYRQAFVIAHTPDTVDAMPGRIVVTGDGDYSTVEVV